MKRVLLIGDSIRMGYQSHVREELSGIARVEWPTANGRSSGNLLLHMEDWLMPAVPDLIHLNCGLHDIIREFGKSTIRTPLAQYEENLEILLDRLEARACPRIIWATTTPVNSERHHRRKAFDRLDDDVRAYNLASTEIARNRGIPINDLYSAVMNAGRDELLSEDGVHFTDSGYRLLGTTVARSIRPWLLET